ncbi:MAG: SHOCT domain-containing protein, partial [Pedobacter sp.]
APVAKTIPEPEPIQIAEVIEEIEDEATLKLRKLKNLYDKHLITQEEYEAKKANILDSL